MPIYDYRCVACSHRFEVIHGVHGDGPAACPACGAGQMVKAVTAPAVHFKGSGWAKMERRSTAGSNAASDARSSSGAADGTGESGKGSDAGSSSPPAKDDSGGAKRETSEPKVEAASPKGDDGPRSGRATPSSAGSSGGD